MRSVTTVGGILVLSCLTTFTAASAYAGPKGRSAPPPQSHAASAPKVQHQAKTPHKAPNPTSSHAISNPALASRLQPLLPAGMTLDQAARGFKNRGQFIAALHVSHNLGIPFTDLKTEMTGTNHRSLGQAIQDLKPTANGAAEKRRAEQEADEDAKSTKTTKTTSKASRGDHQ
jgi:hypothetical protein